MRRKFINILIFILFFSVMLMLLKYVFNSSNEELLFIIFLGTFVGLAAKFSFAYLSPPDWLYKIHYTVEGASAGLIIGLLIYVLEDFSQGQFMLNDLIKSLVVGFFIGIIFLNRNFSLFFRNRKNRKRKFLLERRVIQDRAILTTDDKTSISGELILSDDKLIFFNKNEKVIEKPLQNLIPKLKRSSVVNLPQGIQIDEGYFNVRYPLYWLKKIKEMKV